ncbi:acetyl-CoA carboxylase carboxyltransferase subunit beta [Agrilactobacillus fermenti]|uniref:acetyl-CoA carboxylase carboxyltransferase subunit beta n=1 Tax=Agrilactobacillus fermenti TaxID=2586909 RepID=UPI001E605A2A|nr:acetyl-CoA carboxylase carboxyltransferase subunit beta [Agrilactobacillus fermenti]
MHLFKKKPYVETHPHRQPEKQNMQKVPDNLFIQCPHCKQGFYYKSYGAFRVCPSCGYGLRLKALERLEMLTADYASWDEDLQTKDPLAFPGYDAKLQKAQAQTNLNDSVWTGRARISGADIALGIMDPFFIMGSLGTITGEKITRLFERATEQKLPVVLFTASGGARMQEGMPALMQMAKISQAIAKHNEAGLFYLTILTDPTTGGVTASFAMQGDIIAAEPHTLVGFAGRRVIEQTINKKLPKDFQSAENLLHNGFVDTIIKRETLGAFIAQMVRLNKRELTK